MSADIKVWPKQGPVTAEEPVIIFRPCDATLVLATLALETQLGTIEAYNRLAKAAQEFKRRIDDGDIKAQNPIYARSIKG